MKIAMVTEGTYPVRTGGVSTWCDQLLRGLPEHEWSVVTLTASAGERVTWERPPSCTSMVQHPMWGPWRSAARRNPGIPEVRRALLDLWEAALAPEEDAGAVSRAETALRALVAAARHAPLTSLLAAEGSTGPLLTRWQERHPDGPALSVADAVAAAALVDRTLATVDAPVGDVDLVHAAGNGAAALIGLAELWRTGTPFLLSEHGVFLRERYLALDDGARSWAQRRAVTAVLLRICEVAYRSAAAVLPVSDFNARWAAHLGADPARVFRIHNGVEPDRYAPVGPEPETPTLSFVGRIDPLKDLHTLIRSFALVAQEMPEARLRLFGPVPEGNEAYRDSVQALADELGVGAGVVFEGPSPGSRPAIEAGSVVVLSSISEGLPFSVVEAMMCGRATVSTDVGGVAECLDADRRAGVVVPSRDPEAFAAACLRLLQDDELRAETGRRAREHALSFMTLQRCLDQYDAVYRTTARPAVRSDAVEDPQASRGAPARVLVTSTVVAHRRARVLGHVASVRLPLTGSAR